LSGALWLASGLLAQTQCPPTPIYTSCEILIELTSEEMQAHPNPYQSVTIDVEFRSPRFRTLPRRSNIQFSNTSIVTEKTNVKEQG